MDPQTNTPQVAHGSGDANLTVTPDTAPTLSDLSARLSRLENEANRNIKNMDEALRKTLNEESENRPGDVDDDPKSRSDVEPLTPNTGLRHADDEFGNFLREDLMLSENTVNVLLENEFTDIESLGLLTETLRQNIGISGKSFAVIQDYLRILFGNSPDHKRTADIPLKDLFNTPDHVNSESSSVSTTQNLNDTDGRQTDQEILVVRESRIENIPVFP